MDSQSTRGVFGRWSKKGGYQQIQQWDIKGIVMGYNLAEQEDLGMPKNRGYPPIYRKNHGGKDENPSDSEGTLFSDQMTSPAYCQVLKLANSLFCK